MSSTSTVQAGRFVCRERSGLVVSLNNRCRCRLRPVAPFLCCGAAQNTPSHLVQLGTQARGPKRSPDVGFARGSRFSGTRSVPWAPRGPVATGTRVSTITSFHTGARCETTREGRACRRPARGHRPALGARRSRDSLRSRFWEAVCGERGTNSHRPRSCAGSECDRPSPWRPFPKRPLRDFTSSTDPLAAALRRGHPCAL